jgi:acetyl esterase/lipase
VSVSSTKILIGSRASLGTHQAFLAAAFLASNFLQPVHADMVLSTPAPLRTQTPHAEPSHTGNRVTEIRNLTYVSSKTSDNQQLDLFRPTSWKSPLPVVIYIHGGGWQTSDRSTNFVKPLLENGYAVASIGYRTSGEARWPAQIHDCKAAVRWLRANAKKYDLDASRFGVWGTSSGGHLGALLGLTQKNAALEGNLGNSGFSSDVQAVCDWFGTSDLQTFDAQQSANRFARKHGFNNGKSIEALLGGPVKLHAKGAKQASPVAYASAPSPPFLLLHGDRDWTIPLAQSEELYTALRKNNAPVQLIVLEGFVHGAAAAPKDAISKSIHFFNTNLETRNKHAIK